MLDELEAAGRATVIRMPERGGPSKARNAALERVRGRYVLPVDADNLLLPDAVERLVRQLRDAGETVGFVYPNLQYFGNRRDYFEAPEYNLFWLLEGNYCDTCSLFDADLFARRRALRRARSCSATRTGSWCSSSPPRGARRAGALPDAAVPQERLQPLRRRRARARALLLAVVLSAHPEFYGGDDDFGRLGWHAGPARDASRRAGGRG